MINLKHKRDWEVSVHTTHTSRSQSRSGSHLSYEENTRSMQLEIDRLQRRLRRERRRKTPSNSTFPLMMIDMIVTGPGQGLPLVSPSHMMRVTIISAEIRAHLVKV